jgi:signal transduction histidine kinase
MNDQQLATYLQLIESLARGEFDVQIYTADGDFAPLNQVLVQLAQYLRAQAREQQIHDQINDWVNAGLVLEDVLDNIYAGLREFIPYQRIGVSVIDSDSKVRAIWARSDQTKVSLEVGYSAPLAGSSLETIIQTRQPRIINDLEQYLAAKPESESTKLIVSEGIRSSLTCPLTVNGMPVGFIFFSSTQPNAYADVHIENFQRIANQLSVRIERSRMVDELQEQNRELRRLNELKNRFVGMAAHDLRHPMSYMQLATYILMNTDEHAQELINDVFQGMQKQINHVIFLLDELLDISTIEAGKLTLELENVNLSEIVQMAIDRHTQLANMKNSQIQLDEITPGEVSADSKQLHRILDNLLSNAIKFSPPDSQIRVWAKQESDCWRVSIKDQGPGITPEDRRQLFQDFAKLSARPTEGETSTGLGLAITRRLVEAHGGEIGVE